MSLLLVEALEDRTVPTALGSPWPNPGALTLSFAADGTAVGGATSDTADAFPGIPAAVWQREVLRAFQTWAVHTPADVAVVADGGHAFGTPGQPQGDFRFGDVRVGAVPLSNDSLANVSAFDWSVGTWAGDLLFNTRSHFAKVGTTPTTAGRRQRQRRGRRTTAAAGAGADAAGGRRVGDLRGAAAPAAVVVLHLLD